MTPLTFLDGGGVGPTLDLKFSTNQYGAGAQHFGTPDAVPGWSFTRASVGTAQDSLGNVLSFLSGQPRITDLGLLVEESRTNLLLWSQDLTQAIWTKNNTTAATGVAGAPDGTATANSLTPSVGNLTHQLYQSVTYTAAGYAMAVYAKPNGYNWIKLGSMTSGNGVFFNLSTGVVGAADAGYAGTISKAANGYWRCAVNWTALAASDASGLYVSPDGSTLVFAGDGVSGVLLWQTDSQLGGFITSGVKTTSAAATRAADVASIGGLTFSAAYTLLAVGSPVLGVDSRVLANLSDGTLNNRVQMIANAVSTDAAVVVGGSSLTDMFAGAPTSTTKMAAAFAAGASALSTNGSAVVAGTPASLPAVNRLDIGEYPNGANQTNGYIKRVAVYPTAFSSAQLIAATQ